MCHYTHFSTEERELSRALKVLAWLHSADYKKSSTKKGSSRDFGFLFFLNFILAMPKALYACTNKSKTALSVLTVLGKHRLLRRKIGI